MPAQVLEEPKVDANPAEVYARDLYLAGAPAPSVTGFDGVGDAELAQYREDGLLVIRDAFTPVEVQAAMAGLLNLILGHVPEFTDIEFEGKAAARLSSLTEDERQDAVRKLMRFTAYEDRLSGMSHHPALTALLTRLLGAPPQLFQDMALLKPPQIGREKPWHQDHAYFDYPLGTPICGVWIALDPATTENGCMFFQRGGHKEGVIPHFNRRDWQICDSETQDKVSVAAELSPGSLVVFDGLIPHGTPANQSGQRRRALQFHYAPVGIPHIPTEERLAAFGSEGRNVFC